MAKASVIDSWLEFLLEWLQSAWSLLGIIIAVWKPERRFTRLAGELQLRVLRPTARKWQITLGILVVFWIAGPVSFAFADREFAYGLSFLLLFSPWLLRTIPPLGLGPAFMDVREHGLLVWGELIPWHDVKSFQFKTYRSPGGPSLRLIVRTRAQWLNYQILPEQQDDIERLLSHYVPRAPQAVETARD